MTARPYVLPTAPQPELELAVPPRDDIRPTCRCNGALASVRIGNFAICGGCAVELMRDQGKYHFTDLLHDAENEYVRRYGDLGEQLRASLEQIRRRA